MSSDERIKKLRGSGGYVIARVTDEEQVKGNLGGPDLFLSPIGRLDPGVMSKYYCNTCEKEFEGGPRIDYESPNEEVAENLILAEKGQYACNNCTSTIAEYRVFRKGDESAEVGRAKTEAELTQTQAPAQQAAEVTPPAPRPAPVAEAPVAQQAAEVTPPAPRPAPVAEAPVAQQAAEVTPPAPQPEGQPEAVRPIAGMSVFDENGNVVGTAREVGVAKDSGIVLIVQAPNGGDTTVRWGRIGKIGEVILLRACDDACCAEDPSGGPAASSPACPACGFANGSGAKFCEQCGRKA